MEFLSEYGLFLAKTITFVVAIIIVIVAVVASSAKTKKDQPGSIVVTHLNKKINDLTDEIKNVVENEEQLKKEIKAQKKAEKKQAKENKKASKEDENKKRFYVLDFDGDTKASQVENMRESITAILSIARPELDEVVLRLESPGGMVHAYGLAASQLDRIRKAKLVLTISVDKVAASGGYMMACLGSKIIAAPFAYIGSIGVLLQMPNFSRLLKENNVDFEMITAGEYKRTLTMFGENTDKGREKVTQEIQQTHDLFKDFVKEHRPILDINAVATGETWFGKKALEFNLVDEIKTSDEFISECCQQGEVYSVNYEKKKNLVDKFGISLEKALDNTMLSWLHKSPRDNIT